MGDGGEMRGFHFENAVETSATLLVTSALLLTSNKKLIETSATLLLSV